MEKINTGFQENMIPQPKIRKGILTITYQSDIDKGQTVGALLLRSLLTDVSGAWEAFLV
jgi:hypothetical protein